MINEEPFARVEFGAQAIEWRGPAPFVFVPVPDEHVDEIRWAARQASHGWGCVPIKGVIGETVFTTSLFPRGGTYLLPVKVAVQQSVGVGPGDPVHVELRVRPR